MNQAPAKFEICMNRIAIIGLASQEHVTSIIAPLLSSSRVVIWHTKDDTTDCKSWSQFAIEWFESQSDFDFVYVARELVDQLDNESCSKLLTILLRKSPNLYMQIMPFRAILYDLGIPSVDIEMAIDPADYYQY